MKIHKQSLELLQQIYDTCNKHKMYSIERRTYQNMSQEERHVFDSCISYLKDSEFIKDYAPCVGFPISVSMTPLGIRTIENVPNTPAESATTNIVYGNNYGITGNNATNNVISNGASFDDIRSIILSTVHEQDQQELLNALKPLYERIDIGAPIEQGTLSTISEKLKEYQPLLVAVLSSITTFLTTTK